MSTLRTTCDATTSVPPISAHIPPSRRVSCWDALLVEDQDLASVLPSYLGYWANIFLNPRACVIRAGRAATVLMALISICVHPRLVYKRSNPLLAFSRKEHVRFRTAWECCNAYTCSSEPHRILHLLRPPLQRASPFAPTLPSTHTGANF